MPVLSIAPFANWDYSDAENALKSLLPDNYGVLEAYAVEHDHFQRGKQWVGPGDAIANDRIAKQFAPDDAIGEALSNVGNAFNEAQVGFAPLEEVGEGEEIPEEVQRKIAEGQSLLSGWWDKQRMQEKIQDRIRTSAWAGFAGLRIWIPRRFLVEDENGIQIRRTDSIRDALSFLFVSSPLPKTGGVYVDPDTQDRCAIFLGEEKIGDDTVKRAELVYLDPDRDLDEDAQTVMRVVYSDEKQQGFETRLKLGGRLMFSEMQTTRLLTDPVLRTQQQLNLLCTLITRIGETAAFRERYLTNAKPQGLRIPYEEGDALPNGAFLERDEEGRLWAVIPVERTLGAHTTTELVGLSRYNDEGQPAGQETPSVTVVDPVDPTPYINSAEKVKHRIMRMCAQGHLTGISTIQLSGIAYEQARAAFEKDLNARRVAEEGMLREVLTAVLILAETIAGEPGYFTDVLRVTVDQHVDAGPRSPEAVRVDMEAHEADLLSQETTMARLGVEDVDAETKRIRRGSEFILGAIESATKLNENYTEESVRTVLRILQLPENLIIALERNENGSVEVEDAD